MPQSGCLGNDRFTGREPSWTRLNCGINRAGIPLRRDWVRAAALSGTAWHSSFPHGNYCCIALAVDLSLVAPFAILHHVRFKQVQTVYSKPRVWEKNVHLLHGNVERHVFVPSHYGFVQSFT